MFGSIVFILASSAVVKRFKSCNQALKQSDCPTGAEDDYRDDTNTEKDFYVGLCTCPKTRKIYPISAATCDKLSLSCEGGVASGCTWWEILPQDGTRFYYKGRNSRVTCAGDDDRESRCIFEDGKCNDNPLYGEWSEAWAENVAKCKQNICVDKVWKDSADQTCKTYEDSKYCNDKGKEGTGWNFGRKKIKDFKDFRGVDAKEACCACSGGVEAECGKVEQPRPLLGGPQDGSCASYEQFGGGSIIDVDECIRASSLFGNKTELQFTPVGPKGCFLYRNHDTVNTLYFNSGEEVEGLKDKASPLCRVAAEWDKYCPKWCSTYNDKDENRRDSCEFGKCFACERCTGRITTTETTTAGALETTTQDNAGGVTPSPETDAGGDPTTTPASVKDIDVRKEVTANSGSGDPGAGVGAAIAIVLVLLILGGVGFAIYWFVFRRRDPQQWRGGGPRDFRPRNDSDGADDAITRQVSKPVLKQINGEDVEEGKKGHESSDSDATIDDSEEIQHTVSGRQKPALPTKPKPPVPALSPRDASPEHQSSQHHQKPSNSSFSNDYENDYSPKGLPKEAPAASASGGSAQTGHASSKPQPTPKLTDFEDDDSSDSGYVDNDS